MASLPLLPVSSRTRSRSPPSVGHSSGRSPTPVDRLRQRRRSQSRSPSPVDRLRQTRRSRSRSPSPVERLRQRRRSRSRSPPAVSDDEIDPSLEGMDGLHVGQRVTKARLKNPGKYTDKSMRRVQSTRSKGRERTAVRPAVTGDNEQIRGTCVNDFGMIKSCRDLVTRVNYRPTYVNKTKLPLQMLFAMLLDEQPDVVCTYDGSLLRAYLAGVISRALSGQDPLEPTGSNNLIGFANRAVNLLSQIDTMTGDTDPIDVLAERYMKPVAPFAESRRIIRSSIRIPNDTSVLTILNNLKTLVYDAIPQVRLWSYNSDSPKEVTTVLLRRNQLVDHPVEQLKYALDQSIELFRGGGNDARAAAADLIRRQERQQRAIRSGRNANRRVARTRRRADSAEPEEGPSSSTMGVMTRRQRSESPVVELINSNLDPVALPPTPGRSLDEPVTPAVAATSTADTNDPRSVAVATTSGGKRSKKTAVAKKKRKKAAATVKRKSTSPETPDWLAEIEKF